MYSMDRRYLLSDNSRGGRSGNFTDRRQFQLSDNPVIFGGRPSNFAVSSQFQSDKPNLCGPNNRKYQFKSIYLWFTSNVRTKLVIVTIH